jgi:hypothetical protein
MPSPSPSRPPRAGSHRRRSESPQSSHRSLSRHRSESSHPSRSRSRRSRSRSRRALSVDSINTEALGLTQNEASDGEGDDATDNTSLDDSERVDSDPSSDSDSGVEDGRERDLDAPPEREYPSKEACIDAYNDWGRRAGIAFVRQHQYRLKKTNLPYKQLVRCHRHGKLDNTRKLTADTRKRLGASSGKTGCPAAFFIRAVNVDDVDGPWKIIHQLDGKSYHHNHPPARDASMIPQFRRLSRNPEVRKRLFDYFSVPSYKAKAIVVRLRADFPGLLVTRRDVLNEMHLFRNEDLGVDTKIGALLRRLEEKKYWFKYETDDNQILSSIVFINPRCLEQFLRSANVLLIDCTYKTNRYRMPLLNLVGSSGNNRTLHLGVALIARQDESMFRWVFNHLKCLLDEKQVKIPLFITDRDLAAINAIEEVFPESNIILCRWHINKDVLSYARAHCPELGRQKDPRSRRWIDRDSTTRFINLYYQTLAASTEDEFNSKCIEIRQMSATMDTYLTTNWWPYKEKIVSCFTNHITHFGLTATSRAEGAHRAIKDWLRTSRSDALTLFYLLNVFYEEHVTNIRDDSGISELSIPYHLRHEIFVAVVHKIHRYALRKVAEQLKLAKIQWEKIRRDSSHQTPRCKKDFTTTLGLPCYHTIVERVRDSQVLQVTDFHRHWWIDPTEAPEFYISTAVREPRTLERTRRQRQQQAASHRAGGGVNGTRRDATLPEIRERSQPSTAPVARRERPADADVTIMPQNHGLQQFLQPQHHAGGQYRPPQQTQRPQFPQSQPVGAPQTRPLAPAPPRVQQLQQLQHHAQGVYRAPTPNFQPHPPPSPRLPPPNAYIQPLPQRQGQPQLTPTIYTPPQPPPPQQSQLQLPSQLSRAPTPIHQPPLRPPQSSSYLPPPQSSPYPPHEAAHRPHPPQMPTPQTSHPLPPPFDTPHFAPPPNFYTNTQSEGITEDGEIYNGYEPRTFSRASSYVGYTNFGPPA